ncbi:hypothetical protein Poly30_36990 [Planctomycetes bacterium Poly30]|uniref:Phytanoyl-CoA dioxygenase (PhyH) n=1 Tax=Saltatorellus ferox TaxID=2528018 RepID=A0A518EVP4_9BACT|nr:hypothetical protein Poly30_36990 [Planctomycetes bacterium Poly30]
MRFDSTLTPLRALPKFPDPVLREEASQCRVSCRAALAAGPVHRSFLAALPDDWREDPGVEVFSRLLWLRSGWYPLRPFFHVDWGTTADAPGRVETLAASFGAACRTEFVDGSFELDDGIEPHSRGRQVEALVDACAVPTTSLESHRLYHFDNQAWHRATAARSTGWRLLIRAIRGLDPARRHDGEGTFTSVRNDYVPRTPEELERHAPYATPSR